MTSIRRGRLFIMWTTLYAVLIAAVVMLMRGARQWTLQELSTPTASQGWQTWREDVRRRRDPQADSVQRRVPKSAEPPALVLMRDYFGVCLAAATIFTSLLYAVTVWLIVGTLSKKEKKSPAAKKPAPIGGENYSGPSKPQP